MEPEGYLPCSQETALVQILIQMNPVHIFTPCFCKICFISSHLCLGLPNGLSFL